MNGASVRPTPTSSGATAEALFEYRDGAIIFQITYSGLGVSPTRARVHLGGSQQVGTARLALCGDGASCPNATSGIFAGFAPTIGSSDLQDILSAMRESRAYVVISTATSGDALENGEIRGTVVPYGPSGPFRGAIR
jgi:hypothetical protein